MASVSSGMTAVAV